MIRIETVIGPWFTCKDCAHIRVANDDKVLYTSRHYCPKCRYAMKREVHELSHGPIARMKGCEAISECSECGETVPYRQDICEECCDHSDTDHHCCLICGMDMMETFCAQAEAACEGDR